MQEIAGKGYYDGCKRIDQEVDFEIVINIEKQGKDTYLAMQRGKHRKIKITPSDDLYRVYKFEEVGTIPDDINTADKSRKRIGGATAGGDGSDAAWYDTGI